MSYLLKFYCLFLLIFSLLCLCLEIVKVRWEISQEFENQEFLKIANNKLKEINIRLKTEHYHLNSPARIERHAKEELDMIEINHKNIIKHEE